MGVSRNIIKDIIVSFLDRSLKLKFDICTCDKCREKIMEHLLRKFPAIHVDEDDPNYNDVVRQAENRYWGEMFFEISNAINIVNSNLPHPLEEDREQAFALLLEKVREDRGVDFSQYHKSLLKRRIAVRLAVNKVGSYREYLHLLAHDPQEYEKLFEVLTINVSDFFRDPVVWCGIKDVFKNIIDAHNTTRKPLVLWSAGCAKGEEAYSLAITAKEINKITVPLKIYATDIDPDSLQEAQEGKYGADRIDRIAQSLSQEGFSFDLKKYFTFKEGGYYIHDNIKNMVEFKYLDLTSAKYITDVDMILCRNVFIYFTKPLQERIVDRFYQSLNDKGYLIIGGSENLVYEACCVFKSVDMQKRIFQKEKL